MRKTLLFGISLICFVNLLSFNSFAEGWVANGSNWSYLDKYNNKVYNSWKKGADNEWRYLGDDGNMLTNTFVDEDRYFVDADGILVLNAWKKIDDSWYYFDEKGKKVTNKWRKIDNKNYHFDYDGKMETGWILDDTYYLGEDGAMKTGWQYLYPSSYSEDDSSFSFLDDEEEKKWYYFGTNGKKYVPNASTPFVEKNIGGKRYAFNERGELVVGWANVSKNLDTLSIKSYKFYNKDGSVRTGWYSTEAPEELQNSYNDGVRWYYFDAKGEPKASKTSKYRQSEFVRINNKQYLFNEYGNPLSGLQKVYFSEDKYDIYYLGRPSESFVQKGKRIIEDDDGLSTYYFQETTGRAYTGIKNSNIYYKGKLQRAEDDTYIILSLPTGNNTHTNYVVNKSGRVVKNARVKNLDGLTLRSNAQGVLTSINGSTAGIREFYERVKEPQFYSIND